MDNYFAIDLEKNLVKDDEPTNQFETKFQIKDEKPVLIEDGVITENEVIIKEELDIEEELKSIAKVRESDESAFEETVLREDGVITENEVFIKEELDVEEELKAIEKIRESNESAFEETVLIEDGIIIENEVFIKEELDVEEEFKSTEKFSESDEIAFKEESSNDENAEITNNDTETFDSTKQAYHRNCKSKPDQLQNEKVQCKCDTYHMTPQIGVKKHSAACKRNAKIHMTCVVEVKPYKCDICSYVTLHRRNIKNHMITHTGEKPHKCNICSYATAHKAHLKSHMAIHTGLRPHKCNICSYASTSKNRLEVHMTNHTGIKPYKCDICSFSTAHKKSIQIHMNNHILERSSRKRRWSQRWSIDEKKVLLHCYHYARFEKWNRSKKEMLLERIKRTDLPEEKKNTTEDKLRSLVSQIQKYLSSEDLTIIKEDAHKEAEKDYIHMNNHVLKKTSKKKRSNELRWTIDEKKVLLHCFHYARFEKWNRSKKEMLLERIKKTDLPEEKKNTTEDKLRSLVSQIKKYLTPEDLAIIKEDAHKEAEEDYNRTVEDEIARR